MIKRDTRKQDLGMVKRGTRKQDLEVRYEHFFVLAVVVAKLPVQFRGT